MSILETNSKFKIGTLISRRRIELSWEEENNKKGEDMELLDGGAHLYGVNNLTILLAEKQKVPAIFNWSTRTLDRSVRDLWVGVSEELTTHLYFLVGHRPSI